MTTAQEHKILEAAAKACGVAGKFNSITNVIRLDDGFGGVRRWWYPLTNPTDCAEMCAELGIAASWSKTAAHCEFDGISKWEQFEDHDNSRIKAWMRAATMVAAKIGGYEE